MSGEGELGRRIKSSQTAFGIVEALQELNGAGVVELADHLDLAQSTVHDHLATLQSLEYVVKENNQYRLSLKFLSHGVHARDNLDFYDTAQSEIDTLAEQTGEVVWLYTEEYGRGVVIYKAAGESAMETIGRIGWRPYLHSTAAGKAILAHMPRERVEAVIDQHGLARKTKGTMTTREQLFGTLESIRERGYAINDEENNVGVCAVGAPFFGEDNPLGSVSISGPTQRFSRDRLQETLADRVMDVTERISLQIRYD